MVALVTSTPTSNLEIRVRHFERGGHAPHRENLLSLTQQNVLSSIGAVVEYERDVLLFSEGGKAHHVFVVISGIVQLCHCSEAGKRQVLSIMMPGDLFGMPHGGTYITSARAICPVRAYRVSWQRLQEAMLREPELQHQILTRLAYDLCQAQRRIVILGQYSVPQRLASLLLDLSDHQEFFNAATGELNLLLTRFDLADNLGTSAETVSRAFHFLEKHGLIQRLSSRVIRILNREGLADLMSEGRRS